MSRSPTRLNTSPRLTQDVNHLHGDDEGGKFLPDIPKLPKHPALPPPLPPPPEKIPDALFLIAMGKRLQRLCARKQGGRGVQQAKYEGGKEKKKKIKHNREHENSPPPRCLSPPPQQIIYSSTRSRALFPRPGFCYIQPYICSPRLRRGCS